MFTCLVGNDNSKSAVLLFVLQEAVVKLVVSLCVVFALIGQNGLLAALQVVLNGRMDVFTADDETVSIVDGSLGDGEVVGFLKEFEVFGVDARQFHFLVETRAERFAEGIVINGIDDLRFIV